MRTEPYERISLPGTYSPAVEGLKANAEAAVEELSHLTEFPFGYNRASVVWLEGYLERMNAAGVFNGPGRDKLISIFGAFLGECIVRTCGGAWKKRGGPWGIAFDEDHFTRPFAAIVAQLDRGRNCGIARYFE